MKCYKIFFKHKWQPQQMDPMNYGNKSRDDELNYSITELSEIKTVPISNSAMTSSSRTTTTSAATIAQVDENLSCNNGGCKTSFNRLAVNESPWNLLKTVFFIAGIVALIIWVIIYVLLSHYGIL